MAEEPEVKGAAPEECTCELGKQPDEYRTKPCPIHRKSEPGSAEFGEDVTIITDENLHLERPYGEYRGHIFECPKCEKPGIMVNESMGNFCAVCGAKVLVRSRMVTERIKTLEKGGV